MSRATVTARKRRNVPQTLRATGTGQAAVTGIGPALPPPGPQMFFQTLTASLTHPTIPPIVGQTVLQELRPMPLVARVNLGSTVIATTPTPTPGCTTTLPDGNFDTVQTAITNADPGSTICIPAGDYTWDLGEGPLLISKQVHLRGPDTGEARIIDMGVSDIIRVTTVQGSPIRISHLTLVGGTVDWVSPTVKRVNGVNCIWAGGQGQIRVDHMIFDCRPFAPTRPVMTPSQGAVVQVRSFLARDGVTGVFDHNYCRSGGGLRAAVQTQHNAWQGVGDFGDNSWAQATGWGDFNSAMYYEDNIWELNIATSTSCWAHDSHEGARGVIRYNRLINANFAAHGSEAGARGRGTRMMEIYGNVAPDRTAGSTVFINARSGDVLVWNNTVGAGYTGLCRLDNDRSVQNFGTWLSCDGTFPFDENDPVIYATGIAQAGSGNAFLVASTTTDLWTANQWTGARYSVRNTSAVQFTQPPPGDGRSEGALISQSTARTITCQPSVGALSGPNFHPGDTWQISRCFTAMDQCGMGAGLLLKNTDPVLASTNLKGPANQVADPCYSWGNTLGAGNPGPPNNTMTTPYAHIRSGVHFFNGVTKPGYTPAARHHPLTRTGFTAGEYHDAAELSPE